MKKQELTYLAEVQQGFEWFKGRLGRITGSQVGKLIGKGRNKRWSETAVTYLLELGFQRSLSTAIVEDENMLNAWFETHNKKSKAMEHGNLTESEVMDSFKEYMKVLYPGVRVEETGSLINPDVPCFADSPDGIVLNNEDEIIATLEIKCPQGVNYMRYKVFVYENENGDGGDNLKKINKEYYYQCQSHMLVTGCSLCFFVFYNEEAEDSIEFVAIQRNEEAIQEIITAATDGNEVLENGCITLRDC